MPEHLLDAAEVGASLEQVCCERVAEQMRVHAVRLETRGGRQLPEDQERSGTGQRSAVRIQEELRSVATIEVRPASPEVAAKRVGRLAPDRDNAFLPALALTADQPLLQIDAAALEPDRLAHAEAGAVEQLDKRTVAQLAWLRTNRGLDQTGGFPDGQGSRQAAGAARQVELGRRIVGSDTEENEVAKEGARRGGPPGDRRAGEPCRSELAEITLEVIGRRGCGWPPEPARERGKVAPVGVDGARRPARGEQGEKALELGVAAYGWHPGVFAGSPGSPAERTPAVTRHAFDTDTRAFAT